MSVSSHPFHLMIKPAGARCNLACSYCYYLEKSELYPGSSCIMSSDTLERLTRAYIESHPGPEAVFAWQGGEPLLMGIDFYRQALEFQAKYARPGITISNSIQTNGSLIDDEWAAFFKDQDFLVGISIDGPASMHDANRKDPSGNPSFDRVLTGLRHLQKRGAQYNGLVTVNSANVDHPLAVYKFLVGLGINYLQFIPIVGRRSKKVRKVTSETVRPVRFGEFLCAIFNHWARNDVGEVFVTLFESALNVWMGGQPTMCVFARTCGLALAVEHNGDLYACDHYVYPEYLRGSAVHEDLGRLVMADSQRDFGLGKADLSADCLKCPAAAFCGGDCPKHRLNVGSDRKPMSYLCPSYSRFFTESAPILREMAAAIRSGRPASDVMESLRSQR